MKITFALKYLPVQEFMSHELLTSERPARRRDEDLNRKLFFFFLQIILFFKYVQLPHKTLQTTVNNTISIAIRT